MPDPPADRPDDAITAEARRRMARWVDAPGNPRRAPARSRSAVEADVERSQAERRQLQHMMEQSGQGEALVVAELEAVATSAGGWCTSVTWAEGRITLLERADIVVLFGLPPDLDRPPTATRARWDVVERICGARCWQQVEGLGMDRLVTRRWPDDEERSAIAALSIERS